MERSSRGVCSIWNKLPGNSVPWTVRLSRCHSLALPMHIGSYAAPFDVYQYITNEDDACSMCVGMRASDMILMGYTKRVIGDHMIKLVLSDMDNTLVPFGREHVSQRTIDAIHACQEQGVDFGPTTGRDRAELASFFRGDRSCYNTAVCANGQKVYYLRSLIFERNLESEPLRRAARYVQSLPGCAFITYRSDGLGDWVGITREEMGSMYDRAFMAGGVYHDELPVYPVAKAGIICLDGQDAIDRLQVKLEGDYPEFSFTNSVANWFDISIRGWTKVEGIRELVATLRLSLDEVCVFGDADNDLTMLEYIPNSCAMANANDNAKAAARWHVGASEDDGVAIALEQIAEAARLCNESGREDIMPEFMH